MASIRYRKTGLGHFEIEHLVKRGVHMGQDVADERYRPEPSGDIYNEMPFKTIMECLTTNEVSRAKEICLEHKFRPKLGQLLIASGRLSASDLDCMLTVHDHEHIRAVPMGKLLVIAGLLSRDELSHYFQLQQELKFPSRQQDEWGKQLVSEGKLTPDQLTTALNDQLTKKITLKEALIARGWIENTSAEETSDLNPKWSS